MDLRNLTFKHQRTITPSDDTLYPEGVYVMVLGSAGNVAVTTLGGDNQVWPLDKKEVLPVLVKRVLSTGTNATGITVLFNN